jgi:hypothetical protein
MIVLYIIAGVILLIALLAFVITTAFEHKAEIIISKPKEEVFEYLKSLKNQDKWSVWNQMDPEMKQEFTGTDSTVGFISAWEGKKAGKGAQEIKKITEGQRIDVELRFEKPFKVTNNVYFATVPVEGSKTKVEWVMYGKSPRPFNLIFPLMKGALLKDFNKGLTNLKSILEKETK